MKRLLVMPAWPLVGFGVLLAAACLASTWYINKLQADLARAVQHDTVRMEVAQELQIQLRHLRFHSLMFAVDPSDMRRAGALRDQHQVEAVLQRALDLCVPEDRELLDAIVRNFRSYRSGLGLGEPNPSSLQTVDALIRWSDERHMSGLLAPCRDLADRQQARMAASLERSEKQTTWAGRALVVLGIAGALGGLLAGYATARSLMRRTARLLVQVQAVQAHLDQDVGSLTVAGSRDFGDLDSELDRVVDRVKEVCQRLQEQERDLLRAEQLAAMGHLAAGVAHEIRNPLTGIKFLVEAALRPAKPTTLNGEDLQLILQELLRIERTVQGLLDYARTPPLHSRPHDLREVIVEAVGIVRVRADAKSVSLSVESPTDSLIARVDRDRILSLLTNLLFNAIEATPAGGTIEIRCPRTDSRSITIEVSDSGPGIDEAVADRLFTPFATTKPTGTGLGLSIARQVAVDHGGTLVATNNLRGGACFTFTLPPEDEHHAKIVARR